MVDPPLEVAKGIWVRAVASNADWITVWGMGGVEPPLGRCLRFDLLWREVQVLSQRGQAELERDMEVLADPACRGALAEGLRTAYGLLLLDECVANGVPFRQEVRQ